MVSRLLLAGVSLLSLQGCVAAIPLAAQLAAGASSPMQLCGAMKIPGQSASLCDRIASGAGQLLSDQKQNAMGQNGMGQNGMGQGNLVRTGMADTRTGGVTAVR